MSKLTDKVKELKLQYPKLTKLVNDVEIELDAKEYAQTIDLWAQDLLDQEDLKIQIQLNKDKKIALLEKLGITEDEAKLLLS